MMYRHRVHLVARAGIGAAVIAGVAVAINPGVATGLAEPAGSSGDQRLTTVEIHLAKASLSARSPFPDDFTGNPLIPGPNQRSVTYLLSHDGYTASLSVRHLGTLEVIWTALGATRPLTLATGKGTYYAAGDGRFHLRLTGNGRAVLTRGAKLTIRVAGWYGRATRDRAWLCLYEATESSSHKLVFSNACGP